jgi:hypothetical protein
MHQLSTTEGFVEAFQQNINDCETFFEAYEVTESQHEALFGRRKYSCYHSFATHRPKPKDLTNG